MRTIIGPDNYWRGREAVPGDPSSRGDDEFPQVKEDSMSPLPWRAGSEEEPLSTFGVSRCGPGERYCPHNPPCKGA